ncbi:NAD(P)/FAD-dependent oxidoreductase [Catellatospora tritici]|uniref:NAD(P)/FAD-dependent oxidoreductase n=1 Tax=Catellatospora tritici TaxID=2851566 RepID=UPI001C2D0EC2|nr:NAD(P)/FAD-dependent oxidoreductase [Catellatospora tritici]MBV1855505.1 NAD(P)/FAD-dependent oxidoreductase [Catellatospora tritici]
MSHDADLLVVGGGPAGLATALLARRAGLSVVVAEPRDAPIDKACGEGLMPGGLARLLDLGVDPPGVPFHGIAYRGPDRIVDARFAAGPGRGVRRTVLQAALHAAATRAGVGWVRHRVTGLVQETDAVVAAGVRANWLVGADGLHSRVAREAGIASSGGSPRRYGLRRHWRVAPWSELVEVWWSPHAEAYVTPVAPDEVGVAILHRRAETGHPASYADLLAGFPGLAARLAGAPPTGPVHGAGPLRRRVRDRVRGRVLLVGDAAGYEDALTGEGISLALGQAEAAVAAIVAGQPEGYEAQWRRRTRTYRLLTRGLVLATVPRPLRRVVVPVCAAAPALFGRIVNVLAG